MTPDSTALAWRVALSVAALLGSPLIPGDGLTWRYQPAIAGDQGSAEKQAFEAAKELGTVEAWDAFLSNYSTGFHADLARAYVKKLAEPNAPPPAAPVQTAVPAPPASELPCKETSKLKSERSADPAKLRFVNESDATLIIQWIDFNGALKEYGEVKPGAEFVQDTYLTHPWIAAYQEGSCRQAFLPAGSVSIARLLPESQLGHASTDEGGDHGPTPEQTCKDIGEDYDGSKCVPRKSSKPSKPPKATVERRAKAACTDIGMIYLNGKCAPKKKSERNTAAKNKNKPCPAGTYRNPYGKCQPNETGG